MRISVFITSYNQKCHLVQAIESVLAQTLPASQIIIVDDCSQDGSQQLIACYASRYPELITAIFHHSNQGVAPARIHALGAVTEDYVTYVDGDDRLLPTKLEREVHALERNPSVPIVYSNNYYMTASGIRTGLWIEGEKPPQGNVFYQTFARDFPRRSLFRMELVNYHAWKEVGFHDPKLRLYEDWDMRIRLTKRLSVAYCDEALSEIRLHDKGLSSAPAAEHLAALQYIRMKNRHLIKDLDSRQRVFVERQLDTWRARLIRRAARESLEAEGPEWLGRLQALSLYARSMRYDPLFFDRGLLLRIALPRRAFAALRARVHRH
jgi:glycosyltransferase involved in cell wall biosynthesis